MKNKRKIYVMAIMAMLFLNASIANACMFATPALEAIKKHNVIFKGKPESCYSENKKTFIKFSVSEIWKGEKNKVYLFESPCNSSYWEMGAEYLVYANLIENNHIDVWYGLTNCATTVKLQPWWKRFWRKIEARLTSGLIMGDSEAASFKALGKPKYRFK